VARVLTIKRTVVPQSERKRYMERLRLRRDYYKRAGCSFWVFEEVGLHGAFIEFTEAGEAAVLTAAHANAPESVFDADRVYREVEIG
jgi:hypothetical protein